jgi:transcriptional regulator with XRE-family HTH domain
MAATPDIPPLTGDVESIGALLARVRTGRGMSQLRMAELLCAAAGLPTVTRHEVSRWEREQRVPSRHWLRWLAVVLNVPLEELELAAAAARDRRAASTRGDRARRDRLGDDLARLAHAWLAAPPHVVSGQAPYGQSIRQGRTYQASATTLDAVAARLQDLRRMDDHVCGTDLADLVDRELRSAIELLRHDRPARHHRRLLTLIAELAQLAGWTAADAGRTGAAVRAYRVGLSTSNSAGDRPLGAHVLGCLSHLVAATGDPEAALLLARTGYAGARHGGPAGLQALLLQRVAFAAAVAGDRRVSEEALVAAERVADRWDPTRDPPWLYWLDHAELSALTGRCFAALRRPLRAESLLRPRVDTDPLGARAPAGQTRNTGPRTTALDAGWLAEAYLDAGEAEQACVVGRVALLAAVRSGSPRATARALAPCARLAGSGAGPATRAYTELLSATRPYLPGAGSVRRRETG